VQPLGDTERMSRSNVEIVRAAFDAFARGDLDGVLAMMDPEVLWAPALARVLGAGEVRGTEALRRFFTETLSAGYADFKERRRPLKITVISSSWSRITPHAAEQAVSL
jgi:ketosteroid isomerase-like protein